MMRHLTRHRWEALLLSSWNERCCSVREFVLPRRPSLSGGEYLLRVEGVVLGWVVQRAVGPAAGLGSVA